MFAINGLMLCGRVLGWSHAVFVVVLVVFVCGTAAMNFEGQQGDLRRLFSKFAESLSPRRILRILNLLGLIFPPKDREIVWELPVSDIIRDFQKSRAKHRSSLARKWIFFCLAVHVALTLCEAIRVCIIERIARLIRPLSKIFRKD